MFNRDSGCGVRARQKSYPNIFSHGVSKLALKHNDKLIFNCHRLKDAVQTLTASIHLISAHFEKVSLIISLSLALSQAVRFSYSKFRDVTSSNDSIFVLKVPLPFCYLFIIQWSVFRGWILSQSSVSKRVPQNCHHFGHPSEPTKS